MNDTVITVYGEVLWLLAALFTLAGNVLAYREGLSRKRGAELWPSSVLCGLGFGFALAAGMQIQ